MIDPHVHLRDWNESEKETILHGLKTARECGFNILLDMPNTKPALTTKENVLKRLEDGKKAIEEIGDDNLYYGVYLGLTEDEREIEEMVSLHSSLFPSVCGLKLFASQSTGNMGIVKKESQERIYSLLSSLGYTGVLGVHAEKESLFNLDETLHSKIRCAVSEEESISDQIESAIKASFKGNLHICHISTRKGIELVKEARNDGLRITCGATPHHSLLTTKNEDIFTKMNPPLRDNKDRDSVIEALFDGSIDWVESDHAPHTIENKLKGASGIPGFEGMLRLIVFLRKEKMSEERLNELFSTNAVKTFRLPYTPSPVPPVREEMIEKASSEYPYSAWKEYHS